MSYVAEFEDKEIKEFVRHLDDRLKKVLDGKKEYASLISAIVFKDVIEHFKDESGSEGKWKPWSDKYSTFMQSEGKSGNKILQDSGKLRQSFLPTNYKTATRGIFWFNNAVTNGGFPYAYAHNEGGRKLPKRDFMWLSDESLGKVAEQTLQFMMEKGV
jgi:phage gpG-like protein